MVEILAREGTGRWGHDGRASGGALAGLPLERIAKRGSPNGQHEREEVEILEVMVAELWP